MHGHQLIQTYFNIAAPQFVFSGSLESNSHESVLFETSKRGDPEERNGCHNIVVAHSRLVTSQAS